MTSTTARLGAVQVAWREKRRAIRDLPSPGDRQFLRVRAGLTQDDLARALGVHRETISRWERGERTPRNQMLVAYVDLLRELAKP